MSKEILLNTQKVTGTLFKDFGYVVNNETAQSNSKSAYSHNWRDMSKLDGFPENGFYSYFESSKAPIVCDELESVVCGDEGYICLGMSDYILFVANPLSDTEPDEKTVQAFYIPSDTSIIIKKGVWHWSPFPIDCENQYLLLLSESILNHSGDNAAKNKQHVISKKLMNKYVVNEAQFSKSSIRV